MLRRDIGIALLSLTGLFLFIPFFTYTIFATDIDSKDIIMNKNNTGVTLLDNSNMPFFAFYQAKNKSVVPLSSIPIVTRQAVISSEDKDFYSHPGFSISGIARSVLLNIKNEQIAYGGSTITQQLVKNSLLSSNRSFLRKYQEIVLASEIERRFTKDQILEMYLNSVYFGSGAFGIDQAAQTYFGKHATELTLAESSMLAGILPSPTNFSPYNNMDEAKNRQKLVLENMLKSNLITDSEAKNAASEKITLQNITNLNSEAPHFALMVLQELIDKYGEEEISRSGFKVYTTLNLEYQKYAESKVKEQVEKLKVDRVTNGAAVVIDPKTGAILSLVGSRDWSNDQFGKVNVATSYRAPGSSFKPIVYASALEQHLITPASILMDSPTTFEVEGSPPYRPLDFDRRFRGPVTVRRALSNSLNIPAVQVMKKVGVANAIAAANRLGIQGLKDPSNYGLSLVLGAGEVRLLDLTSVYSVFANGGLRNEPTDILKIEDKYGNTIYQYSPNPQPVLDSSVAFLISSILSDNRARAEEFGSALTISKPAAVKTGTTEDFRDSLTIGYTPSLVVGVWVGNNDNTPMDNVAGSLGAAPIWKALMERFLAGKPAETFEPPSKIKVTTCKGPEASSSAITEYFIKGTEQNNFCSYVSATPSATPSVNPSPVTIQTN
jgi:1A family penicillin-binding protein